MSDMKQFLYNGRTLYYCLKDTDIKVKEVKGKEFVSAYMNIYDESKNHIDVFSVYDEKIKVIYAMSKDVTEWYEKYLAKE